MSLLESSSRVEPPLHGRYGVNSIQSINQSTHVEGFERIVLYKNIKSGQLTRKHTFRPMGIPTNC